MRSLRKICIGATSSDCLHRINFVRPICIGSTSSDLPVAVLCIGLASSTSIPTSASERIAWWRMTHPLRILRLHIRGICSRVSRCAAEKARRTLISVLDLQRPCLRHAPSPRRQRRNRKSAAHASTCRRTCPFL